MLLQDFVNKFQKKIQKAFYEKLAKNFAIKGMGDLGESVKKGKFATKLFFR